MATTNEFNQKRVAVEATKPAEVSKSTLKSIDIEVPTSQLLESNHRVSQNPNSYVSSQKVFTNLKSFALNGNFRNFSKPDYLKLKEPLLTGSSAAHGTTA